MLLCEREDAGMPALPHTSSRASECLHWLRGRDRARPHPARAVVRRIDFCRLGNPGRWSGPSHCRNQTRWSTVAAAKSSRRNLRFPLGDRGRRCFLSHRNESGTADFSLARSILSLLSASIRIALAAEL